MLREKVYLNRVAVDYKTLYARAKDYFHRHGVEITFDFIESDYKNLSYIKRQFPQGERIILQPYMAQIIPADPLYDFMSFVFNGREFPAPNIPTGYCYNPMNQPFIDINLDERTPEANLLLVIHEHMHAIVFKANQAGFVIQDVMDTYILNEQPENPLSNFGQQWKLLAPYLNKPMYKYFSAAEVSKWKLQPSLWQILDDARGIAGVPIIITSGLRSEAENKAAGGVSNSAHLKGLAADILCTDNVKRSALLRGILSQSKPVFIEIAKSHIHIDISSEIHALGQTIIELNDN